MPILTRDQRKQDFEHVMSMLELEPEDSAYKLFVALTQNAKRIILPIMQMNKADSKDLKATDSEGNSLTFDPWEISHTVNINRYANYCYVEAGENIRLKDLNREDFEEFLRSPAYTEC